MSVSPFATLIANAETREVESARLREEQEQAAQARLREEQKQKAEQRRLQAPALFGRTFLRRAVSWANPNWSAQYLTFVGQFCEELLHKQEPMHPTKITHHDKVLDLFAEVLGQFPDVPDDLFYGQRLLTERDAELEATKTAKPERLRIGYGRLAPAVTDKPAGQSAKPAMAEPKPATTPGSKKTPKRYRQASA